MLGKRKKDSAITQEENSDRSLGKYSGKYLVVDATRNFMLAIASVIILFFGVLSSSLQASSLSLGLSGTFFYPTEKIFREIYQSGAQFGGEIVYSFWYNYGLFLRANYFRQEGELSLTRDKTTVKIIPVLLGFRYRVTGRYLEGYLDLGGGVFHFEEENPIGRASLNKLGYAISGGLSVFIYRGLYLGCRLNYTNCRVKPFELEAQIGGLSLGINIGYRFQLTEEEETWIWKEVKEAKVVRKIPKMPKR